MGTSAAPLDQLAAALDATGRLVSGVREEQWDAPTPCTEWTVRDLVDHVIVGNRMFAKILTGEELPAAAHAARETVEPDRTAGYDRAAAELKRAIGQPNVLQQTFTVPFGTVPGPVVLHLRLTELLVHGWDLAQATGQPAHFPANLAEQELAFTRASLANVPADRQPFAPPQPVPDEAPAIDQLAAILGRHVSLAT